VLEKSSGSIQRRQRSRIEHHGTRTPETALFDSYPDVHTSSFAVIFLVGSLSKEGRSLGRENEKGTLRLPPIPIPENMYILDVRLAPNAGWRKCEFICVAPNVGWRKCDFTCLAKASLFKYICRVKGEL
jgi:hypothetical protein